MGEAHDVHGLHGLLEVVFVLLARNGNVSVGEEAIIIEALQQEISYRGRTTRESLVKSQFSLSLSHTYNQNHRDIKSSEAARLTSQMFSCSSQQLVEDVESSLVFGLTNSSGLLQEI